MHASKKTIITIYINHKCINFEFFYYKNNFIISFEYSTDIKKTVNFYIIILNNMIIHFHIIKYIFIYFNSKSFAINIIFDLSVMNPRSNFFLKYNPK